MKDSRPATPRTARGRAFARAALLGNPSDGFGGKTLGFTFAELEAEVTLATGDEHAGDRDEDAHRLLEATVDRFRRQLAIDLPALSGAVETQIPREVGLGGSSAIITATLRALCTLAAVDLDPETIAAIALAVETEDLGIAAGPQDRLIQAHEGLLFMDFSGSAAGQCEQLDPRSLPRMFIAWRRDAGEPSSSVHGGLRARYEAGDRETLATLERIAALAERGRDCLVGGQSEKLRALMTENVAARARLVELDPRHLRMVELARELGAAANYAGSGGAIVGVAPARTPIGELRDRFAAESCELREVTPVGGGFSA